MFWGFTILALFTVSCDNAFEEMSSKTSEDAILYSARRALANGNWTYAISEFARLSAATRARVDVVVDHASAYSGRCGLDFLALASDLDNLGSTAILELAFTNFPATDASNFADCKLAEDLLKTIIDTDGVVLSERGQFLMAFNSIAKIGSLLNFRADSDDDNVVDAGWDPCGASGATDLPQNEVSEIGTGIILFYKNMEGFSLGSAITSQVDAICTAIDGTPLDFCDAVDTADLDDNHRELIRGIIRETSDGLGLGISPGGIIVNACSP